MNARLDRLEAQVADLPASLAAAFEAKLEAALAEFKAGLPAQAAPPADPTPMVEELSATLKNELATQSSELDALKGELAAARAELAAQIAALDPPLDDLDVAQR